MVGSERDAHKYIQDEGMSIASRLIDTFENQDVDWTNKDVLDFGCHWGYVPIFLAANREVNSVTGIDIQAHWDVYEKIRGETIESADNVNLIADDLLTCSELQNQTFDIIITAGTLFTLTIDYLEQIVDWFFDHLKPGGQVLVRTRNILSYNGSDYMSSIKKIPYAHLLFPEHELARYIRDHNLHKPEKYVPFAGSTYIMLFKQAGFEIRNVQRIKNQYFEWLLENHAAKVAPYDLQELNTTELIIDGRKPKRSFPLAEFWKEN
jgi:cyclopropane fatty-acyl-phospholipid synthase-like methyltransferase